MRQKMKILAIGDVVGERALAHLTKNLRRVRQEKGIDLVLVNGENLCDIHGISPRGAEALLDAGVDFITTGNHVFDRRDIHEFLNDSPLIVRPANYPGLCPGEGSRVFSGPEGWRILVINVSGCVFMDALGDPFRAVENELARHRGRYDFAILDIHAEATSEKLALARYFDGQFAVIFGTHTHVPTADGQILPRGSAYITDLGMTGPRESILGVNPEDVIEKMRTHMPRRFRVAEGEVCADGVIFEIDPVTGRGKSVSRISF